jgi:hypothetical protein
LVTPCRIGAEGPRRSAALIPLSTRSTTRELPAKPAFALVLVCVVVDIAGVEGFEGYELTWYFVNRALPKRPYLNPEHVVRTIKDPEETRVQQDGRIQHYRYIPERGYYYRVITTPEGAIHNAFEDENYTRKKRRQN